MWCVYIFDFEQKKYNTQVMVQATDFMRSRRYLGVLQMFYFKVLVTNNINNSDEERMEGLDEDEETADDVANAVMQAVQSSDDTTVRQVSPDELRKVILKVTNEMILPAKKELKDKIKEREQSYVAKIGKVQVK